MALPVDGATVALIEYTIVSVVLSCLCIIRYLQLVEVVPVLVVVLGVEVTVLSGKGWSKGRPLRTLANMYCS